MPGHEDEAAALLEAYLTDASDPGGWIEPPAARR